MSRRIFIFLLFFLLPGSGILVAEEDLKTILTENRWYSYDRRYETSELALDFKPDGLYRRSFPRGYGFSEHFGFKYFPAERDIKTGSDSCSASFTITGKTIQLAVDPRYPGSDHDISCRSEVCTVKETSNQINRFELKCAGMTFYSAKSYSVPHKKITIAGSPAEMLKPVLATVVSQVNMRSMPRQNAARIFCMSRKTYDMIAYLPQGQQAIVAARSKNKGTFNGRKGYWYAIVPVVNGLPQTCSGSAQWVFEAFLNMSEASEYNKDIFPDTYYE